MAEKIVSVSELGLYLQCHYKWDLLSSRRQNKTNRSVFPHFYLGNLYHEAMDLHYDSSVDMTEEEIINHSIFLAQKKYMKEMLFNLELEPENFKDLTPQEVSVLFHTAYGSTLEIDDIELTFKHMYHNFLVWLDDYNERDYDAPFQDEFLQFIESEATFKATLIEKVNKETGEIDTYILSGRLDNMVRDLRNNKIYIKEYKTTSRMDKLYNSMMYWQFQPEAYTIALEGYLNTEIAGVLYTGARSKIAPEPRKLKNGSYSVAMNQDIPPILWLDKVAKAEDMTIREVESDYGDFIEGMEPRKDSYFDRFLVPIMPERKEAFLEWVLPIIDEMYDNPVITRLRNPYAGCERCELSKHCSLLNVGATSSAQIALDEVLMERQ